MLLGKVCYLTAVWSASPLEARLLGGFPLLRSPECCVEYLFLEEKQHSQNKGTMELGVAGKLYTQHQCKNNTA